MIAGQNNPFLLISKKDVSRRKNNIKETFTESELLINLVV